MHLDIYALFEVNWNSSAESDLNSALQIYKFESGIYFLIFQLNKIFTCWSFFLKLG